MSIFSARMEHSDSCMNPAIMLNASTAEGVKSKSARWALEVRQHIHVCNCSFRMKLSYIYIYIYTCMFVCKYV